MSKKDRGKSGSSSADPSRACYPPGNDTGGEAEATVLRPLPPPVKKMMKKKPRNKKMPVRKIDNCVETAEIELAPIAPMSNPKPRHKNDQITWRPQQPPPPRPPPQSAAAVAPRPNNRLLPRGQRRRKSSRTPRLLYDAGCGHRARGGLYIVPIDGGA